MSQQLTQKPRFTVAMTTPIYQNLVRNTLSDPARANRFIASITSAVAVNSALQECEAATVLSGALLGESLGLSPSPQLGQYYLIPFNVKVKGPDGKQIKDANGNPAVVKNAQFVLGYKGYVQLAIRSGLYKKLNVMEIKEGELNHFDPLNEEISCTLIEDSDARESAVTVGYYAMFEYVNGFRKAMYWSREKMEHHADTYSKAFNLDSYRKIQRGEIREGDMWKYSSFWYKNFDDMAKKTMLRQLISRWGIMSIEFQTAFERDSTFVGLKEGGGFLETPAQPEIVSPATSPQIEQGGHGGSGGSQEETVSLTDLE